MSTEALTPPKSDADVAAMRAKLKEKQQRLMDKIATRKELLGAEGDAEQGWHARPDRRVRRHRHRERRGAQGFVPKLSRARAPAGADRFRRAAAADQLPLRRERHEQHAAPAHAVRGWRVRHAEAAAAAQGTTRDGQRGSAGCQARTDVPAAAGDFPAAAGRWCAAGSPANLPLPAGLQPAGPAPGICRGAYADATAADAAAADASPPVITSFEDDRLQWDGGAPRTFSTSAGGAELRVTPAPPLARW